MSSASSSSDNAMKKLLEKCEKLPKWVKGAIQKNYDGDLLSYSAGYLRLGGFGRDEQIKDEMIPELLRCIELFGERAKTLNLGWNKITSKGAMILLDGLKQMKSRITEVYFSGYQLDDECMKSLGEFIENSKTIEKIVIDMNKITDKGIEILSLYLEGNKTIKTFNLYGNKGITDLSVPYLIDIAKKSAITDFGFLNGTSISEEKQREIQKLVAIPIEKRSIVDAGAKKKRRRRQTNRNPKTCCNPN